MSVKDAIATTLNRNSFYRDGYRLMLKISLIQSVVIIVLVLGVVGLAMTVKTKPIYFATTSDGRIINIVPSNEPYRSHAEVVTWAAKTAQKVMQFGYSDYRERLQDSAGNFTENGWEMFNKALKDAKFIEAVEAHKQEVTLVVGAAPEIDKEGVSGGTYTWIVHMPVTIKFDGAQPMQPSNVIMRMTIVRVSTLQNPDGISIDSLVMDGQIK